MRSGRLRQQITLQHASRGQDNYGEKTLQWVDVATVWAGVEDVSRDGRQYQADHVYHEATRRVVIRHRDDVAAGWRVLHTGQALEVLHVDHRDGRRNEIHLLCKLVMEVAP